MTEGITAIGFIILFALHADVCLPLVAESVDMFFTRILPSIFPFYVAANLLINSDLIIKASNKLSPVTKKLFGLSGCCSIAILTGFVSGYPAGAKVTCDLYKRKLISRKEAYTLSAFTNNCGPLFLIGVTGATMLKDNVLGLYLWLIHILSAFITGILFRCRKTFTNPAASKVPGQLQGLSPLKKKNLSVCMTDAMMSMIPVAAAIIFFSALTGVIDAMNLIPEGLSPLKGIIEITGGIAETALIQGLSPLKKMCIISALASWAGISVHIQVAGILSDAGLSIRKYISGKLCQTAIAVILTLSFFCFHPIL